MSRIRANQFTDKAGTGAPTFPNGVQVTGVSTLGNTVVGGGTTQLVVTGNARITGILTIGTSSITLDGSSNQVNVGTGVTLHHTNGIQVGGNTLHSTVLTVNNINASGVVTATSFSGSGANLTGIAATTNVVTNSLVVSGITTVAAGSTAAPSITPTGDSNTGIFFPSADTIAIAEGGSEALRIDSSGNLKLSAAATSILNSSGNKILNQTGSILQVVHTELTTSFSGTSTQTGTGYYVDVTGLNATITPSSASNKILIYTNMYLGCSTVSGGVGGYQQHFRIKRNGTRVILGAGEGGRPTSTGRVNMYNMNTYSMAMFTGVHYDSPASTSSLTYQIELGGYSVTPVVYVNRSETYQVLANDYDSTPVSTLTLMEVAA